jgi:hypothetical protein
MVNRKNSITKMLALNFGIAPTVGAVQPIHSRYWLCA